MLTQRWILVVNRRKKVNLDSTLHQRYFTNVNATSTKRCWNNGEFWSWTDVKNSTYIDSTLHQRYFTNVNATSTKRCWNNGGFWSWTDVKNQPRFTLHQRYFTNVNVTSTKRCWNNGEFGSSTDVKLAEKINLNSTSKQRQLPTFMQRLQIDIETTLILSCRRRDLIST